MVEYIFYVYEYIFMYLLKYTCSAILNMKYIFLCMWDDAYIDIYREVYLKIFKYIFKKYIRQLSAVMERVPDL